MTQTPSCLPAYHDQLVHNEERWQNATAPGWCEWDEEETVEHGHCRRCRSTLTRTLARAAALVTDLAS